MVTNTTDFTDPHASGFDAVGTLTPDALYDDFSVRRKGIVSGGQGVLKRGTLLGRITANREWFKSASAAADGSQDPRGVLLHDVDTTGGDVEAIIGRIGSCNGKALILGAGHTLASVEDVLMDRGIVLTTVIG